MVVSDGSVRMWKLESAAYVRNADLHLVLLDNIQGVP
jgi:hypothetical protein